MTKPSGGFAPEDPDQPGEFNPGPGFMAREKGVPEGLDSRYTPSQRAAGRVVGPNPVKPAQAAAAERAVESWDESEVPDPLQLGS